jgi:hydroxymethylpyrimidine/phosphomethylpyrimidine kinase
MWKNRYSPRPGREFRMAERPVVLLAGGTDSSGGAGLAADVRTVSVLGGHGAIAVTAVTAQTTCSVSGWMPVPPSLLEAQVNSVFDDGPVDAVKTGMMALPETVEILARVLTERMKADTPLVVDPVLRAGAGDTLSSPDMVRTLRERLLPAACLCTPNLDEASVLTGAAVRDRPGMEEAGTRILEMGVDAVLVKGGHLEGTPADVLVTGSGAVWFQGRRTSSGEVIHGTGCTLASAVTALLASGMQLEQAVSAALIFLRRCIGGRFRRGSGIQLAHCPPQGPVPDGGDDSAFYLPPRFCCRCGSELAGSAASETLHLTCSSCGALHYRNPIPAVTLLVHDGKNLLLVRRRKPPARGELSLPGGFLDLAETCLECGARELMEETGLEAEAPSLFAVETDETAYGGIVLTALEVTSWTGDPVPGDDASEVVWVDLDRIPDLAFRAHNRLVAELLRRIDSGDR